ncbi:DUF1819 domain-containing protein [Acidipropionibacterium jensenii]|uniref:DUF1819 family protein n=1 Tax=Acidipropionibacterium jensenii TaxID=1749 RepID=UPI000BC35FC3|nr:DUF1819 family protein [Acidipropionibacterium jensenii]AZZ42531.1 DUF1819 domain-containing protein [Acidipropionibacterium jensenii]
MTSQPGDDSRYALSFTSGALLTREAGIAASLYLEIDDWNDVRSRLTEDNLLQTRTASSSTRLSRETVQRLSVLNTGELELLVKASPSERSLLMWVAACRRYTFIGEFAEEVVRERYLLLTPSLGYAEFDRFLAGKALWHPEVEELKESTVKKLRATVFRMLTESDLFAAGQIQQAVLSERVRDVLDARNPSDVRFLPVRVSMEVNP